MKKWISSHQATIALICSLCALGGVGFSFFIIQFQLANYQQTLLTQQQYEGIAVSIVKEAFPNDPNPEILDIPASRAPTRQESEEGIVTKWIYHFQVNLVNMTNDYNDIWLKVYIPDLVYDHFTTIEVWWKALDNKGETQAKYFDKTEFIALNNPVTGYIAAINQEFEEVVWRDWYTGPISVDLELMP